MESLAVHLRKFLFYFTMPILISFLARDTNGYAVPILVFMLLLDTPRTIKTRELERICLPPGDRHIKHAEDKIECRVMASVSPNGVARWEQSSQPCGTIFINIDNYRKHFLEQHLGCRRQGKKYQTEVVGE